jgi:hypothetical protein
MRMPKARRGAEPPATPYGQVAAKKPTKAITAKRKVSPQSTAKRAKSVKIGNKKTRAKSPDLLDMAYRGGLVGRRR